MTEELKIVITAEVDKLKAEVNKGKEEVEKFTKKGKVSLKDFNTAMSSVGDAANKAMKVAATAIAAGATALLALGASTEEYRTNQAKLNSAFESAGASAETAKTTYEGLYRVLGDDGQATEAAGHLAQLTTNQKDLSDWTNICQGVYAKFGDSLPIESLTEAANETAKTGELTGGLADALNWAGVSEDAFAAKLEKCNSEAEREALIRKTLSGLYSDSAADYEKNASSILKQNEAQAKLNKATAKLGETMAPINTMLAEFGAEVLEKITPHLQTFAEEYGPSIKAALSGIADALGAVIGFIAENWELILTISSVIMAIVVAINLYNAAMAIYNIVMAPVNLVILAIVAAIVALIAIITLCIVYWDEIKASAVDCWDKIKEAWNAVATWFSEKVVEPIKEFFSGLWDDIVNIFNTVKDWFSEKFNAARDAVKSAFSSIGSFFTGIWDKIRNAFSAVGTFFKDKFQSAVNSIKNVFSSITGFFSDVWNKVKSIFSNVGSAIGGAITNTVKTAINGVLSTATKIINGFISAINIAISVINAIPGVNIKKLSKLSVPKLAEGGIVDSATLAMIGEDGKEAVLPLEKNTEWIDKLADRLASRTGGNTPIVLNVDGKTFAQTSINTINELTRQTGSLKLNVL